MKKVICIAVVLIAFIGTISAQVIEKTKRIKQDEVPASVLKMYETNFGSLADATGVWTLVYTHYSKEVPGRLKEKEVLTPVAYVYKNKANKSEVRFKADGRLESVKGQAIPATHGEE